MGVEGFLSPADVLIDVPAPDKLGLLRELCRRSAEDAKLESATVATEILKREELGSTGMGGGVALPHARFAALKRLHGLLVRLKQPLAFDAIDGKPVDIVFLLLLPDARSGQELSALASVARRLRDAEVVAAIRSAKTTEKLYDVFVRQLS